MWLLVTTQATDPHQDQIFFKADQEQFKYVCTM